MNRLPPIYRSPTDFYTSEDLKNVSKERIQHLSAKFEKEFGVKPSFFARAPGRVNLIGEHVDYSLYPVAPMAIDSDVILAVAHPNECAKGVKITNTSAEYAAYEAKDYPKEKMEVDENHSWTNYVIAGLREVFDAIEPNLPPTVYIMVDGTIPQGSGLSSSSALVCASVLAGHLAASCPVPLDQCTDEAIAGERRIGVQCGGMDQAISLNAKPSGPLLIRFAPLEYSPVTLPQNAAFVLADSGVRSDKQASADIHYNKRVVECRLAALLLTKQLSAEWQDEEHLILRNVQEKFEKTLEEMEGLAASALSDSMDYEDVISGLMGCPKEEARKKMEFHLVKDWVKPGTVEMTSMDLKSRAVHVFSEASRVLKFCEEGQSLEVAPVFFCL